MYGKWETHKKCWSENLNGTDHLKDLNEGGS